MTDTSAHVRFEQMIFEFPALFRASNFVLRISAAAFLALLLIHGPAAAVEVRLRASIVCPAPVVRLADVAEIRGDDRAVAEALGYVALCPAPAAGSTQQLSQHQIRQLLALSGVHPAQVVVTGSEAVELLANATAPSSRRSTLPAGTIRQVLFTGDDTVEPAPDSLPPLITPRSLAPHSGDAAKVPQVQRGAVVTISSSRPGIRITTSGKALEAGSAGDTIGVELADSRQRVQARVVGPQTVEIVPDGATASPTRPAHRMPQVTQSIEQ
jgi:Chaperone for flagella basal body P-ring formation